MGLSIHSGPKWEDDSHGYINRDTSEMNIRERRYETNIQSGNDLSGEQAMKRLMVWGYKGE